MVKEIKKELEMSAPLDSITLHLPSADGTLFTTKDPAGNEQPVTLDGMDTIDEALKKAAAAAARSLGFLRQVLAEYVRPLHPGAYPLPRPGPLPGAAAHEWEFGTFMQVGM